MSRQTMVVPFSIIGSALLLIGMMVNNVDGRTRQQDPPYSTAEQTGTSIALTQTADAYVADEPTETSQPTGDSGSNPTATTQSVARTPTNTPTRVTTTVTRAPTATRSAETSTPQPTSTVPVSAVDETATPTPANQLRCVPGQSITLRGTGTPYSGFLVYFGTRAVSGGSVEVDGTFAITVVIGSERPGTYDVVVRERGNNAVLRQIECNVPYVTPTPSPSSP